MGGISKLNVNGDLDSYNVRNERLMRRHAERRTPQLAIRYEIRYFPALTASMSAHQLCIQDERLLDSADLE